MTTGSSSKDGERSTRSHKETKSTFKLENDNRVFLLREAIN